MIISHRRKAAFWKIPRTGSTTIEMILRLTAPLDLKQDVIAESHFFPESANMENVTPMASGQPGERRAHMTPETAIAEGLLTRDQYDSYANFCIVRDPLDRLLSLHHLAFPQEKFDVNQLIGSRLRPNRNLAMYRAQADYLTLGNMMALPHEDFRASVDTICRAFGAPIPKQLPRVTRRHLRHDEFMRGVATDADRAAIDSFYAEDLAEVEKLRTGPPRRSPVIARPNPGPNPQRGNTGA